MLDAEARAAVDAGGDRGILMARDGAVVTVHVDSSRRRRTSTGPQRDVDEPDECRHLDERADDAGERLAGSDTEDADGHRDAELEVVARRGERNARRSRIAEPEPHRQHERARPHDPEVRDERHGDADHVERLVRDLVALQREQDHDREQQTPQRDRPDARQELLLVPNATHGALRPNGE